jgi:hypothetical protein
VHQHGGVSFTGSCLNCGAQGTSHSVVRRHPDAMLSHLADSREPLARENSTEPCFAGGGWH